MLNGFVFTILSEHIDKVHTALTKDRKKLRSLAIELSLSGERQRQRIATGLHDSVGQKLSAAKILAQTLKKKNMTDNPEYMDKMIEYLESSLSEIKCLIFKLSSKTLYELGLNAAVESLIESFEQESSLKYHYKFAGSEDILSQKTNSNIFRIIHELLRNIHKHAKAENVYIDVEANDERINVVIEDDGDGFNASEVLGVDKLTGGYGLFSIQQQLMDVDGQFIIESEAGLGTKVTIIYPLQTTERNLTNADKYINS